MNHLGHLWLAPENLMAGVFLGDFVKGRMRGERPNAIETGIQFHRAVDVFVDQHRSQHNAVRLFAPQYRRYGGIICDVIFDHFLARDWHKHSSVEFSQFCQQAYDQVIKAGPSLTDPANRTIHAMKSHQSLERYTQETYISRSLQHIGTRLSRDNPLDRAFEVFDANRDALESQFETLVPDLQAFSKEWLALHHE